MNQNSSIAPHTFIARAILIRDNCLLVNSTQSAVGEPYCALPGGHVDPGEDCRFALERELQEELNAQIRVGDLALVSEMKYLAGKKQNKPRHEIVLFFHSELENELAMDGAKIASPEPSKNFIWLPLSELPNVNLVPPVLRELLAGNAVARYDSRFDLNFPLQVLAGADERFMNSISPANAVQSPPKNAIELRAVCKSYQMESRAVNALNAVDLTVPRGEFLALVGRSGCGKSTLLNILGGLDRPDSGEVIVAGRDVSRCDEANLTVYRRDVVGIVFQFFNLLPLLTVLENAALPALLAKKPRREVLQRAEHLLQSVGLGERLHQQAALLSGGEMQRVAVARALINEPQIVLADEPTGNLDSQSAQIVLQALRDLTNENRHTVVMVTHSREAAAVADTIREMRDGRFIA